MDGTHRTFNSIVERWDNDERYRSQLITEEGLTREDAEYYDYLAALPTEVIKMKWEDRQVRMRHHQWDVVQSRKGGGRQTIQTTLYPTYAATVEAKAAAPPQAPASSSSSWHHQWWSQTWQTPPWKKDEWWQDRW